jgi:hypothetical protein
MLGNVVRRINSIVENGRLKMNESDNVFGFWMAASICIAFWVVWKFLIKLEDKIDHE